VQLKLELQYACNMVNWGMEQPFECG